MSIPTILATGALGKNGTVSMVGGLEKKLKLAHNKGFSGFIYPHDNEIFLDSSERIIPIAVQTIEQAEAVWVGGKNPIAGNSFMPMRRNNDIDNISSEINGKDRFIKIINKWSTDPDQYDSDISPVLSLIMAAYEPLTFGLLFRALSLKNRKQLYGLLNLLGEHLLLEGDGDAALIKFKDNSFKEWLSSLEQSGRYYIDVDHGHYQLADFGWDLFKAGKSLPSYYLAWLPRHLDVCSRIEDIIELLKDFPIMMARAKAGLIGNMLTEYRDLPFQGIDEFRSSLRIESAFFRERAHIFRRSDEIWSAYKILLQLAIEHADDSPLTKGAENFLREGKCNWAWLRRERRIAKVGVDPCIAVFEGHTDYVREVMILPNQCILSWSSDQALRIWNQYGTTLKIITGIEGILSLSDGRFLTWSYDHTLCLWGLDSEPLVGFSGHKDRVRGASLFPNDRILSWSDDDTLRIWDLNGQCLLVKKIPFGGIEEAFLLPNDRILLAPSFGKTLQIWDVSGKCVKIMKGHKDYVRGVLPLQDGRILTWSSDGTFWLWAEDGTPIKVQKGYEGYPTKEQLVELLPDGRILVASDNGSFCTWDQNGCLLMEFKGHKKRIHGALLLSDDRILSWSDDGTLRIWDHKGNTLAVMSKHSSWVGGAESLPDGRIISWSGDSTIQMWDQQGSHIAEFKGRGSPIYGALSVFTPNRCLLTWSEDNTLRLWDLSIEPLDSLAGHSSSVDGLLNLPSDRLLSWAQDGSMRTWDREGNLILPLDLNGCFEVEGVRILPGERILTWYKNDSEITSWDKNGEFTVLTGHKDFVSGVLLLPDKRILSWSNDHTLRLWKQDGSSSKEMVGHQGGVVGALLLPEKRILSWAEDGTLCIWDLNSKLLKVLSGHNDWIEGVLPLPDGSFWSWSSECIRIWDKDGNLKKVLDGVDALDCGGHALLLPDERIVTWENDGIYLRFWDKNGALLKEIERNWDLGNLFKERGYTARTWHDLYKIQSLSDGNILCQMYDNTIALMDFEGQLLWVENINKLTHSEGLEIVNDNQVVNQSFLSSTSYGTQIQVVGNDNKTEVRWQGRSKCKAGCYFFEDGVFSPEYNQFFYMRDFGFLFADGRAVVSEEVGQVCFLQTYIGNRRASIEELERYAGII